MGPSGTVSPAQLLATRTSPQGTALGLAHTGTVPPVRAATPPEGTVAAAKQGCHYSQYLSEDPRFDGSVGRRSMKMVGGSAGHRSCRPLASDWPSSAWQPGSVGAVLR